MNAGGLEPERTLSSVKCLVWGNAGRTGHPRNEFSLQVVDLENQT